MQPSFANRTDLQHTLFARLSAMFASEVPLYDRSLAVNDLVNTVVCDLMVERFAGLQVTPAEVMRASAERHGAIRIGRPDEYRWIARFFGVFAMEPHNFYAMTDIGAKSQPVIATAFRSASRPEHRVFTSLLVTDRFDPATRRRIEDALANRTVFSHRAQSLIEQCEQEGGLTQTDGETLITEACTKIFKWTGRARDHGLYTDLCKAGFKIAADIACFDSHHLNHLTPNTLCMDLYTAVMKRCFGQVDHQHFCARASEVLGRLATTADRHWLRLHLPHIAPSAMDAFEIASVDRRMIDQAVERLQHRLSAPEFQLAAIKNAGFKDFTEGPPGGTPVLLRQDAYRAVAEQVLFTEPDGSIVQGEHTARFGEIEERFYATTPAGRAMYDACLAEAERFHSSEPRHPNDLAAHERSLAGLFARIPKTLEQLVVQGLVYAEWEPTAAGLAARGTIDTHDFTELFRRGLVRCEGIRYEDFLPISAAGIFASNLNQYGTRAEGTAPRTWTKADLEAIIGRPIIDADAAYEATERESKQRTEVALGLVSEQSLQERMRRMLLWLDETDAMAREHFQSPSLQVNSKPDQTPVTAADHAIEQHLRCAVGQCFPEDGIVGEEHGQVASRSGWTWTIDPIDGTLAFMSGVPLFGTLIVASYGGVALTGACSMPALGERVWASDGGGAWWQRADSGAIGTTQQRAVDRARVRCGSSLARALICTSGSEFFRRSNRMDAWERLAREVGSLRGWSDCYAGVLLVTGRCDGWVDPVMAPWDIGPFPLLVREAGGLCTDWRGRTHENPPLQSVCAASDGLHEELLRLLQESSG